MNGDGILDLLSVNGDLMVLEGVGDGTFGEAAILPVGTQDFALADFDGDGPGMMLAVLHGRRFVNPTTALGGIALLFNATPPPSSPDCNRNRVPDSCDVASGSSADLDQDGVPDECQPDCDGDGVPDAFATSRGDVPDIDADGRPDACERDCNENGIPDDHDILIGSSMDATGTSCPTTVSPTATGIPSPTSTRSMPGISADLDGNLLPDDCDPDCNHNSVPDVLDLVRHDSPDANRNLVPDECDIESGASKDVNQNGIPR